MDFGAAFRKFILGDQSADVIPGVNYKQLNESLDNQGFITQEMKDSNPYYEQSQVYTPNVPAKDTGAVVGGGGSGGGGTVDVTAAARNNILNSYLPSLLTQRDTEWGNIDRAYQSELSGFDAAGQNAKNDFDKNTFTNDNNLSRNRQNSLISAAQGQQGLRSVLASLGALSGTGETLAKRAVSQAANADLGEAQSTYATNVDNLTTSFDRYKQDDDRQRKLLSTERENQRSAAEATRLKAEQDAYAQVAQLFGQARNSGEAVNFLNRASGMNDAVARSGATQAAPFTAKAAAFTPAQLQNYLAGVGDMTVKTGGPTSPGVGSGINSLTALRKREEQMA